MSTDREPGLGDVAHSLTQCTIARHGLRAAVTILHDAAMLVDDVLRDQQQRHPKDWPELKQAVTPPLPPSVPPAPTQTSQTEPNEAKNTTRIPQIPCVGR